MPDLATAICHSMTYSFATLTTTRLLEGTGSALRSWSLMSSRNLSSAKMLGLLARTPSG